MTAIDSRPHQPALERYLGDRKLPSTPTPAKARPKYVLRDNVEAFTAHLESQGASVLDVTPLNLSEIFLEVVGKGKTHVSVEVLA